MVGFRFSQSTAVRAERAPAIFSVSGGAFVAACAALGLGLLAPPLALLSVAAALAFALLARAGAPAKIDWRALAGPLFAAALVGAFWGFDGAMGALFVWRVWADARWSVREARRLGAAESGLAAAHWWTTPALGVAIAAYSAPHVLLGLPLDLPHAPLAAPLIAGAAAMIAFGDWAINRLTQWRLGAAASAATPHALAHHGVFLAAYALSPDISAGLAALIVWRLVLSARKN
ncbi:MAG: hypothetical protein AB7O04_06905 [Hyphomonadaceae bacterium]